MKPNNLTIKNVQARLKAWRASKPHPRARLPKELMAMAVSLCKTHSTIEVSRELKIAKRKIEAEFVQKPKAKLIDSRFVTLPMVSGEMFESSAAENLSFELVRPDGAKMRIYADRNNINFVMSTFLGGQ
jgi:hypothetical protein